MQSRIVASLVLLAALGAGETSPASAAPLPPKTTPKTAPKTAPAPPPAPAADPAPPPAPAKPKDKADLLFDEATAAFDEGKLDEALAKLTAAWKLKESFDIAGNLGIIELKLGKSRDAAEHLAFALRNFPPTESEETREGLQSKFKEARSLVSALLLRVNVERAEVLVDGKLVGRSPINEEIYVNPGLVTVKALHDGFGAAKQSVVAKMEPVAQEVVLDLAPISEAKGGLPPRLIPTLAIGGAAVVLEVVGGILLGFGGGKYAAATELNARIKGADQDKCVAGKETYNPLCPELRDTASSSDSLHNAGVGVMIGGAVVAVGAVAYYFLPKLMPKKAPPTTGFSVKALPVATPAGGGFLMTGTF